MFIFWQFKVPAWLWLGFWFGFQLLGAFVDRSGEAFAVNRVSYNLSISFPTPLAFTDPQIRDFARAQAEVAGIFEGTSEGDLDEPLARSAARLCRKAGADPEAIPAWIEEGRRRSANARRPPFPV